MESAKHCPPGHSIPNQQLPWGTTVAHILETGTHKNLGPTPHLVITAQVQQRAPQREPLGQLPAGTDKVLRDRCGKAAGFARDGTGPSKHGEALSTAALPALSMTRARAAHDHFRIQGHKQPQGQRPQSAGTDCSPTSPGPSVLHCPHRRLTMDSHTPHQSTWVAVLQLPGNVCPPGRQQVTAPALGPWQPMAGLL